MVDIYVNNNICDLKGNNPECNRIYTLMKVRNPNAFFLARYMKPGWDGKMEFIKPNGTFSTGLLQRVINICKEEKIKYRTIDDRNLDIKIKRKFKLEGQRDYQEEASKSVFQNEVDGMRFPRGTLKVATNGGKTHLSAGLHNHYKSKTIFLMNSSELYTDARRDMPKLITHGTVGWIDSKSIVWGDFMICMVATVRNRLPLISHKLKDYRVLVVDECDMAANKTNKKVIENLYNTVVRVGLSGTINASKLAKDKIKNWTLEGFFGQELYYISNRTLIDKGVSSEVAVKFLWGNKEKGTRGTGWMNDMEEMVVKNKARNKKALKRSIYHMEHGRNYQLIIAQRKKHVIKLYKLFKKHYGDTKVVEWAHGDRKDRKQVSLDFMNGKIDILIGSMIYKRGKNFHKMKYMLNAGAGKSPENILQLLGRAFRGCKHYEDFLDDGKYLAGWTRKRGIYYQNEKLKVTYPKGVTSIQRFNKNN